MVAALGEVGIGVGETELHEPRLLIGGRSRHRGSGREVPQLRNDSGVCDELLRNRHRLFRIGLGVLPFQFHRATVHSPGGVQFFEGQIEALLPVLAVLGAGPGSRSRDPEDDGSALIGGTAPGGAGAGKSAASTQRNTRGNGPDKGAARKVFGHGNTHFWAGLKTAGNGRRLGRQ